ncbi:MAG TPA: glycosyltransferase family 1 protein, partial [Brevundimonas sp.]|nr:glycosyltransferase family 1 protein [Brevundimonas sp.]
MARTVLFDAGRLLQRSGRTTPTGVDRVCLAYAEWLMGHPDVRFVPVRSRGDHLTALDRKWFGELAASLRERWTGNGVGEAERTLTDLL